MEAEKVREGRERNKNTGREAREIESVAWESEIVERERERERKRGRWSISLSSED